MSPSPSQAERPAPGEHSSGHPRGTLLSCAEHTGIHYVYTQREQIGNAPDESHAARRAARQDKADRVFGAGYGYVPSMVVRE
jgi:hypothetical protein